MISFNDDPDYEPIPPFWVTAQRDHTVTATVAGPCENVGVAFSLWVSLGPEPGAPMIVKQLIMDGRGTIILGYIMDELRPPHSHGGGTIATTPRLLALDVQRHLQLADVMGVMDTLAKLKAHWDGE